MIAYQKEHGVKAAAVIGGGLLGLEAAKAMYDLGMETHIIEYAPILMCRQVCVCLYLCFGMHLYICMRFFLFLVRFFLFVLCLCMRGIYFVGLLLYCICYR